MTPERWLQICEILDAAFELEPEEVPAFIEETCAHDDDMQTQVKSFYGAFKKREMAFERPAPEIVTQDMAQRFKKPMLEQGQCLGERYEICDQLGKGGFAQVFKAKDKRLSDRYVAVKIFSPSPDNRSPGALKRFRDEARAVANLGDPHIVTVLDIGQHDIEGEGDTPFIVTEFIDGITLHQRLKDSRLKLSEALNIAIQLTDALIPVHREGVVHRDIKPENIMLGAHDFVKIVDFGVAKLTRKDTFASESQGQAPEGTQSGDIIGSNKYTSPEQLRGWRDVDGRSDIWAVGVVLYEMLAGRVPFDGPNRYVVSHRILSNEKPKPLSNYSSEVTPALSRLVFKALNIDREKRYQTTQELLIDLQKVKAEIEAAKSKGNPLTVFFSFISRAFQSLGAIFKSKNLNSTAPHENLSTGDDSEVTRVVNDIKTWLRSVAHWNARPTLTTRGAVALKWGKAHRKTLAGGVALLFVLIVGLTYFYSGTPRVSLIEGPPATPTPSPRVRDYIAGGNTPTPTSTPISTPTPTPMPTPTPAWPPKVVKRNLKEHRGVALAVAFSPNGKIAASGNENGVRLWDTSSWQSKLLQSNLEGQDNIATSIAFSHDSEMVASSSEDKTILLWNREDQYQQAKKLSGHAGGVHVVAFSPTEKLLASGGKDKSVILWDLRASRQYPLPHNEEVLAVAFSPDGKTLASASKDGTIRVWDVGQVKNRNISNIMRSGEFKELCVKCGEIYALAFSCDGKTLVGAGGDNTIRRWNWQAERELTPAWKQNKFISSLAFSPDCTMLATASGDGTVRLWNIETGEARILGRHEDRVNWLSFSRDWMLISGSHDRTVRIWKLTGG